MSRFNVMPRAYRRQLQTQDSAAVARATRDNEHLELRQTPGATAPGDHRKLRGIPAIGPSVTGAIPGTRPGDNLWR